MEQYLSFYQNWVGLLNPKMQLLVSGFLVLLLFGIFIKFFIRNIVLIFIFIILGPLYWPILKNFLLNIVAIIK